MHCSPRLHTHVWSEHSTYDRMEERGKAEVNREVTHLKGREVRKRAPPAAKIVGVPGNREGLTSNTYCNFHYIPKD